MTSGQKVGPRWPWLRCKPAAKIAKLEIELRLLEANRIGHRQVVAQLEWLLQRSRMHPEIAREVNREVAFRKVLLRRCSNNAVLLKRKIAELKLMIEGHKQ